MAPDNIASSLPPVPTGLAQRSTGTERCLLNRAAFQERRSPTTEISTALVGAELTELTREELFVLVPAPQRMPLPVELFDVLRARGVRVRLLHNTVREPLTGPIGALAGRGIALPTTLHLPYFLVVRDRAVVYQPHHDPGHPMATDRLTRVRSVVMASSMATAFTMIWETAARRAEAVRTDDLDDGRDLLRVLGDGLTDDRAAARLHMSKRTFARRVAELMRRLDASTRFQAGVRAARRGWV